MRALSLIQLIFLILAISVPAISSLNNANVEQKVTISSQIATHVITVEIANEGKEASSSYEVLLPVPKFGVLSAVEVTDVTGKLLASEESVKDVDNQSVRYDFFLYVRRIYRFYHNAFIS